MAIAGDPKDFLRRSDVAAARECLRSLAPELVIDGPRQREQNADVASAAFPRAGVALLPGLTDVRLSASLVAAIASIRSAGLPAVMVYVFDELWHLGERVERATSRMLGERYVIADDVWAFHVPPGRAGWPPHRGIAHEVLDRERPEVINAWIALSDASIDRSCMHVVPLDDDPGYPHDLASIAFDASRVRPMPIAAGSALAWNANVLHWGGPCLDTAAGPRTSCTFTLVREDAMARMGIPVLEPQVLDFGQRLDVVAGQVVTYGEGQPDVDSDVLSWARANVALRSVRKDR